MITEDYCDFETAKLLKEKDFDIPCREHYYQYGELSPYSTEYNNWNGEENYYSCPTLQMAMKWLRKDYNLFIDVYYDCDFGEGYRFSVHKLPKGTTLKAHDENYSTYEEACEAAIKYCLENLI